MENLVKVSTYAKMIDKSITWVYRLIENKEVKLIIMDGVKFVELEKED